jgi:RNA 2',3'-cyclic 3'-phosphodiesterase
VADDRPAPEAAPREPTRRLFFALWPDAAMREALVRSTRKGARASDGRPVPGANLHLTLAFLGSVPQRRLGALAEIARASADLPAARLELAFDHLEYWRAAQLLCALPRATPVRIASLAQRLQDQLAASGFAPDLKSSWSVELNISRPFRPHVTLARKVYRPPRVMEIDPVTWSFADFVLVDSKTLPEGSVYTVLERFPLRH